MGLSVSLLFRSLLPGEYCSQLLSPPVHFCLPLLTISFLAPFVLSHSLLCLSLLKPACGCGLVPRETIGPTPSQPTSHPEPHTTPVPFLLSLSQERPTSPKGRTALREGGVQATTPLPEQQERANGICGPRRKSEMPEMRSCFFLDLLLFFIF